jgi:hypothetical protein
MKEYSIDKYQFDVHQHPEYLGTEVVASSTYAGKPVNGKAICHVGDEYNEEIGFQLAAARCAEKVARKRMARANKMYDEALREMTKAKKRLDDMLIYQIDSRRALNKAEMNVKNILKDLK